MSCKECGKTDFEKSTGCKHPKVFSPEKDDWVCSFVPSHKTMIESAYEKAMKKINKELE